MLLHMATFRWGSSLPLHKYQKHVKARAVLPASHEPTQMLSEHVRIKYHLIRDLPLISSLASLKNGKHLYGRLHHLGRRHSRPSTYPCIASI